MENRWGVYQDLLQVPFNNLSINKLLPFNGRIDIDGKFLSKTSDFQVKQEDL